MTAPPRPAPSPGRGAPLRRRASSPPRSGGPRGASPSPRARGRRRRRRRRVGSVLRIRLGVRSAERDGRLRAPELARVTAATATSSSSEPHSALTVRRGRAGAFARARPRRRRGRARRSIAPWRTARLGRVDGASSRARHSVPRGRAARTRGRKRARERSRDPTRQRTPSCRARPARRAMPDPAPGAHRRARRDRRNCPTPSQSADRPRCRVGRDGHRLGSHPPSDRRAPRAGPASPSACANDEASSVRSHRSSPRARSRVDAAPPPRRDKRFCRTPAAFSRVAASPSWTRWLLIGGKRGFETQDFPKSYPRH